MVLTSPAISHCLEKAKHAWFSFWFTMRWEAPSQVNNAENVTGSLFQYETSISFVSSLGVVWEPLPDKAGELTLLSPSGGEKRLS